MVDAALAAIAANLLPRPPVDAGTGTADALRDAMAANLSRRGGGPGAATGGASSAGGVMSSTTELPVAFSAAFRAAIAANLSLAIALTRANPFAQRDARQPK